MRRFCARAAFSLFFCLLSMQLYAAEYMQTAENSLTPFGFTRFCLQKPERCVQSRKHIVRMDEALWSELDAVNTFVNRAIVAEEDGSIIRPWRDETQRGDCKDYALSKRSQLIDRGWPASALLIAIAEVPSGGMHAVLVVVTDRGDLVLDNLGPTIANYRRLPYRWDKRMSPNNPQFWQRIISWLRVHPGAPFFSAHQILAPFALFQCTKAIEHVGPILHQLDPLGPILCAIVGPADFVLILVP